MSELAELLEMIKDRSQVAGENRLKRIKLCLKRYPEGPGGGPCLRKRGHAGGCDKYKPPQGEWFKTTRADIDRRTDICPCRTGPHADPDELVLASAEALESFRTGTVKFEVALRDVGHEELMHLMSEILDLVKRRLGPTK